MNSICIPHAPQTELADKRSLTCLKMGYNQLRLRLHMNKWNFTSSYMCWLQGLDLLIAVGDFLLTFFTPNDMQGIF